MSKLDIKLVEKMYSDYGQELTPERLDYITNQFSNNNDFSSSFLKKYDPEKAVSSTEVEKKNLDSTSTSEEVQSVSPTQEPKKKSLSVGGKPVQTGASASSVGKDKGKKAPRSSEELLSEFGFKNKEEQKKAGAVASKVKVGAATPVAVKSTQPKEDVFKTEKQKAIEQEGSLITEKYKREEEKKFVEDFRNATAVPDDYEAQVRNEVQSELEGTGLWNAVTQGAANVWNKILPFIPGAPSSKEQIEQLKSEVTFLPKAMEEYKSMLLKDGVKEDEITTEELTKGAINLEVQKRLDDKKLSLANDYLDNLPNDVKDRMESKALNEVQINNPEVTKKFNLIKTLDADIKEDNDELVKLEELSKKNNGLSPEDADRHGLLTASLKSKIQSRNKQYNSYKESVGKLTTAEQEYDLFKRTYGFEDKAGKILNAVSDFGLGSLQFINMLTPEANQDNIALELAGIKNKKDKLVAEKFQKQVDNAKNLNDMLDYGSDVLISQSANVALGYLTGGTGMMLGMGTSAAGNRYSGLIKSNLEGETDYSKLQMYISSGIYGASETIESNTMRMIGGAKNIIGKAIKNEPYRKLLSESLASKTYKTGKEFLKNYKGEFGEELTTFTSQKISDIVVLDIDSKDVFKNAKEELKSLVKDTGVMVVGLNLFPATFSKVTRAFAPKDYTYNLDKNNKLIDQLTSILQNKDASDVTKLEAKNKIDQIVKANEEGLIKVVKNTANIDDKLIEKVIEIESANSNLRNKAEQINSDKTISRDQKELLLSGLKEEFIKNESLREDIILGRKTSFDILPSEEQTNIKKEAANLLKQDQLNKGVVEDDINISAEEINKKAKDLYSQKIKQENEKITGQTDTEKEPTGINAEQTTDAAQQKDGMQLQSQEEVDKLRAEEINELKDNVENPDSFITDGKVDANKIAESDNAKAKEIYAKYDKLLKPLLNNIKTQKDAIQKQSTNEGLLQPEQSKMGLQEVEQGDKVNQVVAEQSQEKVNTKISDPYTSAEVDRVKTLPAESEDGATMNLDGSKYEGGGLVIPLASKNMDASELTPQAIQDFIDENAESVGADNVKVGIYKFPNSNQVSVDINIVADPSNREEALAIGKELGQESLFDLNTFENVKTGADGMNPKKLTPEEFKAIQLRLKTKPGGVEVSKDINQAKKQVSSISNKKIARSILNGVKAISKILPNVKIVIHNTDDSFRNISGESKNQESSGLYVNGVIHINVSKANARTVGHEIFHAILLDKVKTDFNAQVITKKMIESIAAKIDNNTKLKAKLEDFASMYDDNIQNEEKLAELVGIMAENYNSLSVRAKEIIKNWLNNLAKSFGVELFKDNEVFDVLNTIAKKVATGSQIGVEDISILDNGTNPIGGPTEIRIPKKRESKIDFKDSYENSLVTPDKKVDIYSLLEDIVAKKQKIWFWVADQLGVNNDLDGGPSFAHQKDGDIWASSMSTKSIENNINKSDYIFIISGSPTVSKLFNKKVFDKMTSNLGSFDSFKKETLKRKPTKDIVEILNNFKSWDDLRSSTSRKPFLIAINESSKKPNTEFHKYIKSLNGYFDLNDFRDGFYRDNNFEQNDIMLVLKPTGVRSGSEHSTYENTIEGEVIGVPDSKINALEVMPKEMADKYSGKNAQASQAIAPYGSGVKEISTIPSKRQQKALPSKVAEKLTEDEEGNIVFKHYSDQKRDVIKKGQGNNAITSREEGSALSAVGGLAMFYTMEGQKEAGVGNVEHTVLISKDKVYDIDSDPLGFEKEARSRFNKVRPGQAFTNNHRGAFITQIANEKGFDIAVTQWRGSELRAQTTKELAPSEKAVDFKERPLDTFKVGDRAIIDGKESIVESVDGQKIGYKSIDGTSQGVTVNNERNRRSIIKIEPETSARKQKQSKQELSDAKKEIQEVFSAAKEALKIEKDRNKVINDLKNKVNAFVKVAIQDLNAGDIGKRAITSIASKVQSVTDQNFDEKLLEVNAVLDNLYTNRDVNKAKADKKKALKNVMAGKVGKLDKKGDRAKVMASKIVNFALLDPAILKKVLDDANFGLYTDYISNLAERKDALSDTDMKSYERLYDEIAVPYKEYTDKVNQIQGKIDTNVALTAAEQAFVDKNKSDFYEKEDVEAEEEKDAEKEAKKEAEIAKKKAAIKALLPMMPQVFEDSDAEKGSFEWKILSALTTLDESDIDAMPESMLSNVTNALNSMINDDVVPTYAEDLYRYTVKNKAKNLFLDAVSKAGKGGLYRTKAGRAALKAREILGNPSATIRGIIRGNIEAELLEKRIKMFRFSAIDAALKIYGETPIFDGIASVLGKGMSNLANTEAKAEEALLNAKKLIDKKSKNPQESYMKITYHLIDAMAKNNQGTKSDVSAMEYFEATISDPNSKIRDNRMALKAVQDFIAKVKSNGGSIELTPDEATAANAIRIVLDENQVSAYEANLFQNANAAPMIAEYFPVSNSVNGQTDNDLANMKSRFGIGGTVSTKSGNLEEKTGKAHPIDMNPFTAAFSSIKNTAVQFNLRSEYLAMSQGLKQAIKESDIDEQLFLNGIQKALDSEFDLIVNGSVFGSNDLMDDIFNAIDKTFYQVMLGSVISRSIDYTGNIIQLAALNPKLLVSGNKIIKDLKGELKSGESEVELLRAFYKNAEASDINKMISSKSSSTERTEFLNKGVNKDVLSKGLPFSNIFTRIKAKFVNPVDEKLSGINESLISISDVKPYGISWNSVFRDAFLSETGNDVDVAKVARGDKKYLKDNADAIKRASNKANRESADLFGSTNPFEKQVGIMEITAGKKNSRNPLSALINRAKYFLSGFNIGANTSMTTAINTFLETKDPREARKALGGAIRVGMYRTAVSAVSGMIWSLFKGDDDDEDKLVESFDRLTNDDKFIKEMNNLFLDFPIRKDRDGNPINLSMNDFEQYNKLRDKLLSNKDFKNAYDIYYKFINRNLFDEAVRLRANQINNSKEKVFKENIVMFFDEIKRGFPKDDTQIIETLAVLHSNEGAKLFTSDEVDGYILDLENHMSKIGFLDNRALRDANSQIDRMIVNETALLLSDHRNESADDIVIKEGAQLLMGLMFPRSNNIIKGSYNYLAESANKSIIQSRRGERGYDLYKDMMFQPISKIGLVNEKWSKGLVEEAVGVLNPALKDLLKKNNKDAATVSLLRYIKTIGTIGLNDFNKINSKMKNDEIYQKTNGKFKKNIIDEIAKDKVDIIRSVTDKEGIEKDAKERGAYKSRVLPGIDSTEVKSNLPSYMDKKDLKINGRSVE